MDFQTAFNVVASIAGVLALFVLNMAFSRITEAKHAGIAAAEQAKSAAAVAVATAQARAEEALSTAERSRQELHDHKLHVAENYISVKRFEGFETAIFKKLDAIENKLDGKADKTA